MFRNKTLYGVPEDQQEELAKSWKIRGYLVSFEDEKTGLPTPPVEPEVESEPSKETLEDEAAKQISADDQRSQALEQESQEDETPPVEPEVESEPSKETLEEETPTEPEFQFPENLQCPHCGAKARTEASYLKNHGDNCFKKPD